MVTIAHAKRENIPSGLGQCIATMLAAQQFNREAEDPTEMIYGVVTTGPEWKFLTLSEATAHIDSSTYFVTEVDKILGIFQHMLESSAVLA